MPSKTVRDILSEAITTSSLNLEEITERAGFEHPSMFKMILQGLTQMPLSCIPVLARVLDLEERRLLRAALHEYHPELMDMLTKSLRLPEPDVELGLAVMIRLTDRNNQTETAEPFRATLEAFLDLAASSANLNHHTKLN